MIGQISSGVPTTAISVHTQSIDSATANKDISATASRPKATITLLNSDRNATESPRTRSIRVPGEWVWKNP